MSIAMSVDIAPRTAFIMTLWRAGGNVGGGREGSEMPAACSGCSTNPGFSPSVRQSQTHSPVLHTSVFFFWTAKKHDRGRARTASKHHNSTKTTPSIQNTEADSQKDRFSTASAYLNTSKNRAERRASTDTRRRTTPLKWRGLTTTRMSNNGKRLAQWIQGRYTANLRGDLWL